jgi:hypothetical protein
MTNMYRNAWKLNVQPKFRVVSCRRLYFSILLHWGVTYRLCKISGFHGGDYDECRFLGCGAVVCSHLLTLIPRSRIFLPWRCRRYIPPKKSVHTRTTRHHIPPQKTAFFNVYSCFLLILLHYRRKTRLEAVSCSFITGSHSLCSYKISVTSFSSMFSRIWEVHQ